MAIVLMSCELEERIEIDGVEEGGEDGKFG